MHEAKENRIYMLHKYRFLSRRKPADWNCVLELKDSVISITRYLKKHFWSRQLGPAFFITSAPGGILSTWSKIFKLQLWSCGCFYTLSIFCVQLAFLHFVYLHHSTKASFVPLYLYFSSSHFHVPLSLLFRFQTSINTNSNSAFINLVVLVSFVHPFKNLEFSMRYKLKRLSLKKFFQWMSRKHCETATGLVCIGCEKPIWHQC